MKLLAHDANLRYSSARELLHALEGASVSLAPTPCPAPKPPDDPHVAPLPPTTSYDWLTRTFATLHKPKTRLVVILLFAVVSLAAVVHALAPPVTQVKPGNGDEARTAPEPEKNKDRKALNWFLVGAGAPPRVSPKAALPPDGLHCLRHELDDADRAEVLSPLTAQDVDRRRQASGFTRDVCNCIVLLSNAFPPEDTPAELYFPVGMNLRATAYLTEEAPGSPRLQRLSEKETRG